MARRWPADKYQLSMCAVVQRVGPLLSAPAESAVRSSHTTTMESTGCEARVTTATEAGTHCISEWGTKVPCRGVPRFRI